MINILFCSKDKEVLDSALKAFQKQTYQFINVSDWPSVFEELEKEKFDATIVDLDVADEKTFDLVLELREKAPSTQTILIGESAPVEFVKEAMNAGVSEFLKKPIDELHLKSVVDRAVEEEQADGELSYLRDGEGQVHGSESAEETAPAATRTDGPMDSGLVPLRKLQDFALAPTPQDIVNAALSLIQEEIPHSSVLTTSCLLFAMVHLVRAVSVDRRHITLLFLFERIGQKERQVRDAYFERRKTSSTGTSELPDSMTPYVVGALDRAQHVALDTTGAADIHVRHMLAGLLLFEAREGETGARLRLREMGADVASLRNEFLEYIRETFVKDDLDAWKRHLTLDQAREASVWINVGRPREERSIALLALEEGQTITWAVPRSCAIGDFVFMWVSGGTGFKYAFEVVGTPRPAEEDEYGPFQAALRVIEVFESPISIGMLREHSTLRDWALVRRNMQGATKGQTSSLLVNRGVWIALRDLLVHHNPDAGTQALLERIEPRPRFSVEQHFLSDQPSARDHIGHEPIVEALAAFLQTKNTDTPLVIGIDAPWGAGKSSVMTMLQKALQQDVEERDERVRCSLEEVSPALDWRKLLQEISAWRRRSKHRAAERQETRTQSNAATKRRFETVYFNAWRHGTGAQLTASLVNHILQTIANRKDPVERELFWLRMNMRRLDVSAFRNKVYVKLLIGTVKGAAIICLMTLQAFALIVLMFLKLIPWLCVDLVSMLPAFLFGVRYFRRVVNNPVSFDLAEYVRSPDYDLLMGPQAKIEKDFRELLRLLDQEGKTLAVFVDDLDRCPPKCVVEVVEAINVFFGQDIAECVFVLGMHRDFVAMSLELAYENVVLKVAETPGLADELPFGQRFLEKIVQFVVRLPEPSKDEVEKFVGHLIGAQTTATLSTGDLRELTAEFRSDGEFLKNESNHRQRARDRLVQEKGYDEKDADALSTSLVSKERAARIAESFDEKSPEVVRVFNAVRLALRSNPRQYVRFFNALRFEYHLEVFKTAATPTLDRLLTLAKQVVISLEWPLLSSLLAKKPGQFQQLIRVAKQGDDLKGELRELFGDAGKSPEIVRDCLAGDRLRDLLLAALP